VTAIDEAVAGPGRRRRGRRKRRLSARQELPLLVGVALVLALLVKTFLVQAFVIPSASMEPTVMTHDRILANKLVYAVRDPHRGEVVVFSRTGKWPVKEAPAPTGILGALGAPLRWVGLAPSGTDFIKRVIGLPGDTVSCCDATDHILVNGQPLTEPYAVGSNTLSSRALGFTSVTVPPGQLFVMGDNRGDSLDSRYYGLVPISSVIGRAVVVMYPVSHWKGLPVPATVEQFTAKPPAAAAG
jgi:signal peptidase I